jgi:hypothetical protein
MTEKEAMVDMLIKCAKIYIDVPKKKRGGQSCGTITYPTIIEIEDLDLKLSVGLHKANYKNKQSAIEMMTLILNTIVK